MQTAALNLPPHSQPSGRHKPAVDAALCHESFDGGGEFLFVPTRKLPEFHGFSPL